MGPYVTMVVAIFLIVFTGMTLQSKQQTCDWPSLTDSRYCNVNGQSKTIQNASSSARFASTIQACKNVAESAAKILDFHPVYIIWRGGSTKDEAKIDEERDVPYIQKRINVPVVQTLFEPDKDFKHAQSDDDIEIDGKKYEVFYPMKSGELLGLEGQYTSKSRCDPQQDKEDRYCEPRHRIYFIDYQVVFLRHLNPDGTPVIVPGTENPSNSTKQYNVMDVYQSTEAIDDNEVGALPDEAFDCRGIKDTVTNPEVGLTDPSPRPLKVYIPDQQASDLSEQMQLEWFVLGSTEETPIAQPVPELAIFEIGCKPAVYLYPPQKQLVNVKVFPKGFLTYTDPVYDQKNGWTVEAYPDGKIYDSRFTIYDKPFNYLYYESKIRDEAIQKPDKGWIVQSSAATDWFTPLQSKFETLLPQLGLNEVQTKDFIEYWKKALPHSPYYFIGIMDQTNIDQFEALNITPKPDYINRVRIYFERLEAPKQVAAPLLEAKSFKLPASSFNVVEWGGMVKNDPNHPFTCSQ